MASIIKIKHSYTAGAVPVYGTTLDTHVRGAELAYAFDSDKLYIGDSGALSTIVIGGKFFTDMLDHTPGALTASSAIITDTNSKIDQLLVDDITIDGNSIASAVGTDLVLSPDQNVSVTGAKITNLGTPTADTDAVTKLYVDTSVGGLSTSLSITDGTTTDSMTLADSDLSFSGNSDISVTLAPTTNNFAFALTTTGVTADAYGGPRSIGAFEVDAQGRITNAADLALPLATADSTGIAAFDVADFSVTTGVVTIATGGVSNAQLANSSITIGTDAVALGASITDINGLTSLDVDNITIDGNAIVSSNGAITLGNAITDNITVAGNLIVEGNTTTLNTATLDVEDKNITVAKGATVAAGWNGAGITVDGAGVGITYVDSASEQYWNINAITNIEVAPGSEPDAIKINGDPLISLIYGDLEATLGGRALTATVDGLGALTLDADIATTTTLGVSFFNSSDFNVAGTGEVTINTVDGGTF